MRFEGRPSEESSLTVDNQSQPGNVTDSSSFTPEDFILNDMFTSSIRKSVIDFYDNFDSRKELISWMERRPDGSRTIREVEGSTEVVVVIPTSSFEGKHAIACRDSVFRGLHMIFVDNGGSRDRFFNFSRSVNAGMKLALDYRPSWIIYSNDDMYRLDDINILTNGLSRLDNSSVKTVFTNPPGSYHSHYQAIARASALFVSVSGLASKVRTNNYSLSELRLLAKYHNRVFCRPAHPGVKRFLFRDPRLYLIISSFGIFSEKFVREVGGEVFDRNYINGFEDIDLSIKLTRERADYDFVDYEIGDVGGQTLGQGALRSLRDIVNVTYFNHKIETGEIVLE